MTDTDKVKELVEWAKQQIRNDRNNTNISSNGTVNFINFPTGVEELAKQILSHSDLALIAWELPYPDCIIPLTPAIKELAPETTLVK